MKKIVPLLCFVLIASASYEITKDSCMKGKLILGQCLCEFAAQRDFYLGSEARLECDGNGAMTTSNKLLQMSEKSLVFTELSISSSDIKKLKRNSLEGFTALRRLDLPRNNIVDIDKSLFANFNHLEVLDLSGNRLVTIERDAFMYLGHLKNLSLSDNEIATIDADAFQHMNDLVKIDLSKNSLYHIEYNWFSSTKKLLSLNIADNEIFAVKADSFENLPFLQVLDLSGNKLEELSPMVFFRLTELRHLSLAANQLQALNGDIFKGNKLLEQINLTGNLWVCDRKLLPLSNWIKSHEIDKSYCSEPPEFKNSTLQHALLNLFLELKLEESPICNSSMCNCSVSRDKQVITVDCSNRGLTKVPENLPYKTRALNLTSNAIRSLNMKGVNTTQWAEVSFLHLDNNFITSLQGFEGSMMLRNLVALHLKNNQLSDIPIHILEQFRGGLLDELYLEGNPWNCDCNTVRFQTWLQDNYKTAKDFHRMQCSPQSGQYSEHLIQQLLKSQLCPQDVQLVNYLDVLNGLMAVAIVLIVVKLSYDYWLQKRTGKLPRFFSLNI